MEAAKNAIEFNPAFKASNPTEQRRTNCKIIYNKIFGEEWFCKKFKFDCVSKEFFKEFFFVASTVVDFWNFQFTHKYMWSFFAAASVYSVNSVRHQGDSIYSTAKQPAEARFTLRDARTTARAKRFLRRLAAGLWLAAVSTTAHESSSGVAGPLRRLTPRTVLGRHSLGRPCKTLSSSYTHRGQPNKRAPKLFLSHTRRQCIGKTLFVLGPRGAFSS